MNDDLKVDELAREDLAETDKHVFTPGFHSKSAHHGREFSLAQLQDAA